jgi:hypothetical protein
MQLDTEAKQQRAVVPLPLLDHQQRQLHGSRLGLKLTHYFDVLLTISPTRCALLAMTYI